MNTLSNLRNRRGRKSSAFTLIELIVVILIIAILAALVVPKIVGRTTDAKIAKAQSDIAEMKGMLEAYRVDNDKFPTTEEGLNALMVQPSDAPNWKGPYTQNPITVDPWNNPYQYTSPGPNGEDFVITCYGADGAPGGEGPAADISSNQ